MTAQAYPFCSEKEDQLNFLAFLITERGDHKELLAKSGLYYQMWQSQEKELD